MQKLEKKNSVICNWQFYSEPGPHLRHISKTAIQNRSFCNKGEHQIQRILISPVKNERWRMQLSYLVTFCFIATKRNNLFVTQWRQRKLTNHNGRRKKNDKKKRDFFSVWDFFMFKSQCNSFKTTYRKSDVKQAHLSIVTR